MSRETFEEDVEKALDRAIVNDVDPEELDAVLEDAQRRVNQLRAIRGGDT